RPATMMALTGSSWRWRTRAEATSRRLAACSTGRPDGRRRTPIGTTGSCASAPRRLGCWACPSQWHLPTRISHAPRTVEEERPSWTDARPLEGLPLSFALGLPRLLTAPKAIGRSGFRRRRVRPGGPGDRGSSARRGEPDLGRPGRLPVAGEVVLIP